MPSGPESLVGDPAYHTQFTRARGLLLAHPGRWRVIYHYDGDGIASASSALRALRRLGYGVQATAFQGVRRSHMEEILRATAGPVWVVDTGASWLDLFAKHPHPVLILDHHKYPDPEAAQRLPDHVAFVNPLDWGVDGMSEMCAATLTWLYTILLDPRNWDNAPWGISGAIADRQHVGGFRGPNAWLMEEALRRDLLARGPRLGLSGPTLASALVRSIDPYFRGLSNHPEAVTPFIKGLGIDPAKAPGALSSAENGRLGDALVAHLTEQGVRPEFIEGFRVDRWSVPSLGLEAEELSNLQNATGRLGTPGLGIALALGDPGALDRAREAEEGWRTGILTGLKRLEEGAAKPMRAIQWFESPENSLAGTQAGLAMNYLLDPHRPVLAGSRGEDPVVRVSGRGTLWLVGQGLDLAGALRDAAASVGGEGGGHRVAAGATVPADRWSAFLEAVDRIVLTQLTSKAGGAT
jgi:RecJ-like exonuclease